MMDFTKRRKDILVGFVILIVLAGIVYFFNLRKSSLRVPENENPTIEQVEGTIESKFKINVPDNIEKTQLVDVSGGDGSGIATRDEILVDLPDPEEGRFYQAWLEKDGKLVSLGKMIVGKGGFLITYSGSNYPSYNKVVVSLEKVFDSKMESKVLEGSF